MAGQSRFRSALIVGAADGVGAALARRFTRENLIVAISARNTSGLESLVAETGALAVNANPSRPEDVRRLIAEVEWEQGPIDIVAYNVSESSGATAYGGYLIAQEAAQGMVLRRRGAIVFADASSSAKGCLPSALCAVRKGGLGGVAQSMARELAPEGIQVAHFVTGCGILSKTHLNPADRPDGFPSSDAIADHYWHVLNQHRRA